MILLLLFSDDGNNGDTDGDYDSAASLYLIRAHFTSCSLFLTEKLITIMIFGRHAIAIGVNDSSNNSLKVVLLLMYAFMRIIMNIIEYIRPRIQIRC